MVAADPPATTGIAHSHEGRGDTPGYLENTWNPNAPYPCCIVTLIR